MMQYPSLLSSPPERFLQFNLSIFFTVIDSTVDFIPPTSLSVFLSISTIESWSFEGVISIPGYLFGLRKNLGLAFLMVFPRVPAYFKIAPGRAFAYLKKANYCRKSPGTLQGSELDNGTFPLCHTYPKPKLPASFTIILRTVKLKGSNVISTEIGSMPTENILTFKIKIKIFKIAGFFFF